MAASTLAAPRHLQQSETVNPKMLLREPHSAPDLHRPTFPRFKVSRSQTLDVSSDSAHDKVVVQPSEPPIKTSDADGKAQAIESARNVQLAKDKPSCSRSDPTPAVSNKRQKLDHHATSGHEELAVFDVPPSPPKPRKKYSKKAVLARNRLNHRKNPQPPPAKKAKHGQKKLAAQPLDLSAFKPVRSNSHTNQIVLEPGTSPVAAKRLSAKEISQDGSATERIESTDFGSSQQNEDAGQNRACPSSEEWRQVTSVHPSTDGPVQLREGIVSPQNTNVQRIAKTAASKASHGISDAYNKSSTHVGEAQEVEKPSENDRVAAHASDEDRSTSRQRQLLRGDMRTPIGVIPSKATLSTDADENGARTLSPNSTLLDERRVKRMSIVSFGRHGPKNQGNLGLLSSPNITSAVKTSGRPRLIDKLRTMQNPATTPSSRREVSAGSGLRARPNTSVPDGLSQALKEATQRSPNLNVHDEFEDGIDMDPCVSPLHSRSQRIEPISLPVHAEDSRARHSSQEVEGRTDNHIPKPLLYSARQTIQTRQPRVLVEEHGSDADEHPVEPGIEGESDRLGLCPEGQTDEMPPVSGQLNQADAVNHQSLPGTTLSTRDAAIEGVDPTSLDNADQAIHESVTQAVDGNTNARSSLVSAELFEEPQAEPDTINDTDGEEQWLKSLSPVVRDIYKGLQSLNKSLVLELSKVEAAARNAARGYNKAGISFAHVLEQPAGN